MGINKLIEMSNKICPKCGLSCKDFYKNKAQKDGLDCWCIDCTKLRNLEYSRTKEGLISKIYNNQVGRSKKYADINLTYSKEELREFIFSRHNFEQIFTLWRESGYQKELSPSIDRIDDYAGYSLDNISLINWGENRKKFLSDKKNGINNKDSVAVRQLSLNKEVLNTYYSSAQASRETGVRRCDISNCLTGRQKTAKGFIWEYLIKQVI